MKTFTKMRFQVLIVFSIIAKASLLDGGFQCVPKKVFHLNNDQRIALTLIQNTETFTFFRKNTVNFTLEHKKSTQKQHKYSFWNNVFKEQFYDVVFQFLEKFQELVHRVFQKICFYRRLQIGLYDTHVLVQISVKK